MFTCFLSLLRRRLPTIEALLRTILACDKTVEVLKADLETIRAKVDSVKRIRSLRGRRDVDLSLLANSLLKANISSPEESTTSRSNDQTRSPEISALKLASLREYLAQRPPTVVTPTRLSHASESMIMSRLNMILEQSRIDKQRLTAPGSPILTEPIEQKSTADRVQPVLMESNTARESLGGLLGLRVQTPAIQSTPLRPTLSCVTDTSADNHNTYLKGIGQKYAPKTEPVSPPEPSSMITKVGMEQTLATLSPCKPFAIENKSGRQSGKGILGVKSQGNPNKTVTFSSLPTSSKPEDKSIGSGPFNLGTPSSVRPPLDFNATLNSTGGTAKTSLQFGYTKGAHASKTEDKPGSSEFRVTLPNVSSIGEQSKGPVGTLESIPNPTGSLFSFKTQDKIPFHFTATCTQDSYEANKVGTKPQESKIQFSNKLDASLPGQVEEKPTCGTSGEKSNELPKTFTFVAGTKSSTSSLGKGFSAVSSPFSFGTPATGDAAPSPEISAEHNKENTGTSHFNFHRA